MISNIYKYMINFTINSIINDGIKIHTYLYLPVTTFKLNFLVLYIQLHANLSNIRLEILLLMNF